MTSAATAPSPYIATIKRLLDARDVARAEQAAAALIAQSPGLAAAHAMYARCAAQRGDWVAALNRWIACRDKFPEDGPVWRVGLGYALLQTERYAEAHTEFARAGADGDGGAALAGCALALSHIDPEAAEPAWQQVEAAHAGVLQPRWQWARARALIACGRYHEAVPVLEQLVGTPNPPVAAWSRYAAALVHTGRHQDLARELADGRLRSGGEAGPLPRAMAQLALRQLGESRRSFAAIPLRDLSLESLRAALSLVPRLFGHFEREQHWRTIRAQLHRLLAEGSQRASVLLLRVHLALRDHRAFLALWDEAPLVFSQSAAPFARAAETLRGARFPDFAAPKIFGIGLSRTGTSSMATALQRLGFLHGHFFNPFSEAVLEEQDFALLDSANDTPVCYRFEQLDRLFPNARFILTERPLETWEPSLTRLMRRQFGAGDIDALLHRATASPAGNLLPEHAATWAALYAGHASLQAAYTAFEARVISHFSARPGKLLRHNVFAGDGWQSLCEFLGREPPDSPYPYENRG